MDRQRKSANSSDKTTVLDVKPLRCLAPMFPAPFAFSASSAANVIPFVCISPFDLSNSQSGPSSSIPPMFPTPISSQKEQSNSGIFNVNGFNTPPKEVKPLNERMGTPEETTTGSRTRKKSMDASDVEGSKKKRSKHRKKHSKAQDLFLLPSSSDDPREPVEVILSTYDALRRRLLQIDEANNASKNSHLKSMTIMMDNNLRVNATKTIGSVPGINIGDVFYLRFEMCLVGLHNQSMGGIDYMNTKINSENDTLAVSIVSSGGYDNETNDTDVLIYSGQGGSKTNDGKLQVDDQKLERGNLALERSLHRSNLIRVIRGIKDFRAPNGKIYFYDGLYKIHESWIEKGKSGFNVFKYKLLREPGQPDVFALWKTLEKWKENPSSREGVIVSDISGGKEATPICMVNETDTETSLGSFSYSTKIKYSKPFIATSIPQGCSCCSGCLPSNRDCPCIQKNGGDLPYSSTGLLIRRKPVIYECSSLCQCLATCQQRATQRHSKLHFEVFRTANKGWGLRSWDSIRAGTFICEYTGELVNGLDYKEEYDDYIFETEGCDKTFKWNYGPELLGEPSLDESWESLETPPITITAKNIGNLSRFMNHSCSPNVFWQLVQHEHGVEGHPHVMFFAMKHIPPLTELTYDYGQSGRRSRTCLCGSRKCRGVFG